MGDHARPGSVPETRLRPTDGEGAPPHGSVLAEIRLDILTCWWMPNERLTLEALRGRYQVGWSPIREALMRLVAEGHVSLEHNKGFRVAGVSRDDLVDLMRSRIEIESIALRWSIRNGGIEWEADVLAALHRLSRHRKLHRTGPRGGSVATNPDWSKEHRAFHEALVGACDSPTILAIRRTLFEKAERYVALAIIAKAPPRDEHAEHEAIMKAALARDVDSAVRLNRQHIERTLEKVMKSLASHREFARSPAPRPALPGSRMRLAG
ncbi:MAG: GntR family transcriptional regulator [Acetobacteraceae bacterium]